MSGNRRVEERGAEGKKICEMEINGVEQGLILEMEWCGVGWNGGGDGMDRYGIDIQNVCISCIH